MDSALFSKYIDLINSITGLSSPEANHGQVRRAIHSYSSTAEQNEEELLLDLRMNKRLQEKFLNDVLIGETYFFREAGHFNILSEHILPSYRTDHRPLKAWSASCSTGEEAISLAVLLDDFFSSSSSGNNGRSQNSGVAVGGTDVAGGEMPEGFGSFTLHATDINSKALNRLIDGVYPYSALRQDGGQYHRLLLDRYTIEQDTHTFTIAPELLRRIRKARLNLFSDPLDLMPKEVDVIFFRNTLIYFKDNQRRILIDRLVSRMNDGGFLFLAAGEIPFISHPNLVTREIGRHHVLMKTTAVDLHGVVGFEISPAASAGPPENNEETAEACTDTYDPELVLRLLNTGNIDGGTRKPETSELHREAARQISFFFEAVNRNSREEAGKLLEIILSEFPLSALSRYCAGWYHYTTGRNKEAMKELYEAIRIDELFWPARFYYALLLKETEKEKAVTEFEHCARDIAEVREREKQRFAFLLAEFDDSYFLHMCERWIEKLRGGK